MFEKHGDLRNRFLDFQARINCHDPAEIKWGELSYLYEQEGRHYHKLSHIASMLRYFDRIKDKLDNPDEVEAAIWYHDAIYAPQEPGSTDEEQSADLACTRLEGTKLDLDYVKKLINATRHHTSDDLDNDTKYLLDIDLSILGQNESRYGLYASNIRKEYSFVGDQYASRRAAVMKNFLGRDRIYHTEEFEHLEQTARRNIKHEVFSLARESRNIAAKKAETYRPK